MSEHPLKQWLEARKRAGTRVRKGDLAKAVGCSPSRISQLIHSNSEPSLSLAVRLSQETGLPVESFLKQDAC